MKNVREYQATVLVALVMSWASDSYGCNPAAVRSIYQASVNVIRSGSTRSVQHAAQSAAGEVVSKSAGQFLKKIAIGFGKYGAPSLTVGAADVIGDTVRSQRDAKAMENQLVSIKDHQMQLQRREEEADEKRRLHEKEMKAMELQIAVFKKPDVKIEELHSAEDDSKSIQMSRDEQPLSSAPGKLNKHSLQQSAFELGFVKPTSDVNSVLIYFGVFVGCLLSTTICILCCCYFFRNCESRRRVPRVHLPRGTNATICIVLLLGIAAAVGGSSMSHGNVSVMTEHYPAASIGLNWIRLDHSPTGVTLDLVDGSSDAIVLVGLCCFIGYYLARIAVSLGYRTTRFAGGIGALFCILVAVLFVMSTSEAALVSRLRLNLPTKIPRGDIIVEFPDFEFIQNLSRQAKDGLEQNIVDQRFIRRTLGKASEILGVAFNDFGVVEIVLKGIVPILALVTLVYYLALRMSRLLKETLLSIVRLN